MDRTLPRLAVLPFENLGAPQDDFFADGITDEILTKLAGLSGLAVISTQTVMGYKGTTKNTKEIGRELNVQYLVQGRIRWQRLPDGSSRVRVTPRLIQVADDRQLWASDFDDVLEDVFRVQGQIATQVASALGVALLSREHEAVARRATQNLGAYEQYLKGNVAFRTGFCCTPALWDAAVAYEQAVRLDPRFAMAYARLSIVHGGIRWQPLDPDTAGEHLAKQEEHAERALALDAGLPEGHLAMGYYHYWGHRDYERALQEFGTALDAEPNNSSFINAQAVIYKRTGDFAAAAERFSMASDLDPMGPAWAWEAGVEYLLLRRYDEGERYAERYAAITGHYGLLAGLRLARDGDPLALRTWLDATIGSARFLQFIADVAHRGGGGQLVGGALVNALCGACNAAIPLIPNQGEGDWWRYEAIALLHERGGRPDLARVYYDSARVRRGEGPGQTAALRRVYAKLGRKDDAVRAALEHVERQRELKDVFQETVGRKDLADVHVTVGDYNGALTELEWLLSHPSTISVPLLRADPLYDPLRTHPRFQALLAKYQN